MGMAEKIVHEASIRHLPHVATLFRSIVRDPKVIPARQLAAIGPTPCSPHTPRDAEHPPAGLLSSQGA